MNAREREREEERNKKLRFLFICSIHNKKRELQYITWNEEELVGDGSVGE